MKTVIVTGGAGFIGSHLTEALARRYRVIVIDDLSTGRKANLDAAIKTGNVEFIEGSVTDLPLLERTFTRAEFVFHQAAIASVPRSIAAPLATDHTNTAGTLSVLLAARDNNVKKVIFASSCAVYGDNPTLPTSEGTLPEPKSPYAVTKLAGEHYCRVFTEVYGLSTVCLRYFNVYGPRQDPASDYAAVIPKFIRSALDGKAPTIYGDGEQTRDFAFVADVVKANILAAESAASGIYNIASGTRASINRLAELVWGLTGKPLEPVYAPVRPGDVRHSLADISKARSFGYNPECTLEDGLRLTVKSLTDAG